FNIVGEATDCFGNRVRQIGRVKVDNRFARRGVQRLAFYDSARDAHHRRVWWHRGDQHRTSAHPAVSADGYRSQNRRAAEDRHGILDGGVSLDGPGRRAAERYALINRHVVTYLTRLSDHHSHTVIDK